jgi:hypothetical protein
MTISTNPQEMGTLFSILIFDDYIFVYMYIYIYMNGDFLKWGFLKMGDPKVTRGLNTKP